MAGLNITDAELAELLKLRRKDLNITDEVLQNEVTAEVSKAAIQAVDQIKDTVEDTIVKVAKNITVQNAIHREEMVKVAEEHTRKILAVSAMEAQNGPGLYLTAGCACIMLALIIYVACQLRGMKKELTEHYHEQFEDQGVEQVLHIKNPMRDQSKVPHQQLGGIPGAVHHLAPPPHIRNQGYNSQTEESICLDM